MYLKSIELSGFKSFARKSTLAFSSPIAAIVGPNGSGKSNTAEAFRFVLGEQSIKSMRGARGEDMIWSGTGLIPRSNRAAVKVTFDNAARFLDIDFDEVHIERVVHRDGVNEYTINGSAVRLKDILTVLAKANIGSSGHHIISQGEADRILNASPRERRAMIEDALGLRVFQYKKGESERKLRKTVENIATTESLRREVAPHLRFLERQMKKRDKAFSLRDQLITACRMYFAREEAYISHEREVVAREAQKPKERFTEIEKELHKVREKIAQGKAGVTKSAEAENHVARIKQELATLRSQKNDIERAMGTIEGQLLFVERKRDSVPKDIQEVVTVSRATVQELITSLETAYAHKDPDTLQKVVLRLLDTLRDIASSSNTPDQVGLDVRELQALESEKNNLEQTLRATEVKTRQIEKILEDAQQKVHDDEQRDGVLEREMLKLTAEYNEVRALVQTFERRADTIAREKDLFEEGRKEAGILVGLGALQYECVSDSATFGADRAEQERLRRDIERMKIQLEEVGVVGEETVKEYTDVRERDDFLQKEVGDLQRAEESLRALINDLDRKIDTRFKEGLHKIHNEFNTFFTVLFGGGTGALRLLKEKRKKGSDVDLDSAEEIEDEYEGIEVEVQLPRKKVHTLNMLSGGERALTSIALIFAMSQVNPPPFIILDETDAALDEANSRRYANIVRALSEKSQLILITHNRATMEAAGELYGVTMGGDGASKLLSVKFDEAVQSAK